MSDIQFDIGKKFDIKKAAASLVSQMTLEEKVSQMLHGASEVARLNIPSYNWWNEALHGVARAGTATMFPQAIALAATFELWTMGMVADAISTEARAKYNASQEEGDHDIYKGLTFWSPNINIFRDPRWGRGHETYGEDPYLTARMGVAFIRGLQGPDRNSLKAAACAKHFAVHSGPENERHEFNAAVDSYDLWNTYLPAFEAAVKEAGVEAVMGAYNRTLGEPCCGSKLLLVDILRGKWGFDGHVVSDCWAIKDFHEHHRVTKTPEESAALAVKNGCDVNCGFVFNFCLQAVQAGLLTEEQIDRAVTRLFVSRMRLGMLGAPQNPEYASISYENVDCERHQLINLIAAKLGLVLLKNDGALPLKHVRTLGVIGPNADSRRALEGNYQGTPSTHVTILQGLQELAEEKGGIRVMYAEGCHLYKDRISGLGYGDDRMSEAVSVTKRSDAVVLCLGLDADIEGEEGDTSNEFAGGDKVGLELPGRQQALLETVLDAAHAGGKPVIVVLVSGSALTLGNAQDRVNGILQAFYPGSQGGRAVAEALFGRFSPSGKLPVTFYRSADDLPDFRDYSMENRTYRYFKGEPLYPFGFGLSYGRFELSNPRLENGEVRATLTNTGKMDCRETVQLYASVEGAKERWCLCGFTNVFMMRKGYAEISIPVPPTVFCRYDANGDLQPLPGKKTLYLGFTQPDERSIALYGQAPLKIDVL
ncbi:MAG: glycoside hydrolase family 3 C-terminal domain-containing protein [Clostridiales bacterium]|jgi:beta-glucosidase|nr:glycoside hydrolase family 3 C-terminal domain-containing protein [Clostridiales bacterium]